MARHFVFNTLGFTGAKTVNFLNLKY